MVINSDLNGTLNSDFNTRKINTWNYIVYNKYTGISVIVIADTSTFQDNTNNTSTRFYWHWKNGITYTSADKNYCANPDPDHIILSADFRPIIEYRE